MAILDNVKKAFGIGPDVEVPAAVPAAGEYEITADTEDAKIIQAVGRWRVQDAEVAKAVGASAQENRHIYKGIFRQDNYQISVGKSEVVVNRIFTDIKAVVPFVTSKPAEPVCYMGGDTMRLDEEQKAERTFLADCTQAILRDVYQKAKVQAVMESACVNRYTHRVAVLRYGVDPMTGRVFVRNVDPGKCFFDCSASSFDDQYYFGEERDETAASLAEAFPESAAKIWAKCLFRPEKKLKIVEWWTRHVRITTLDNEVLEKAPNPYHNDNPILRYYQRAPIPYVAMNVYRAEGKLVDDVTEIDLTRKLQEQVNKIARQMSDNVEFNCVPAKVANGAISKDQVELIARMKPGDAMVMPQNSSITYLQATPFPQQVYNLYLDLLDKIDAVFGTLATFRGESEGVMSGASREVLRTQSGDTLAQVARSVERCSADLYRGWLHIILAFIDDEAFLNDQIVPVLGTEDAKKYRQLLMNDRRQGIEVKVLPGSILPDDKATWASQALELAQRGRISNETLYERLGYPNPEKEAEKTALEAAKFQIQADELKAAAAAKLKEMDAANSEADSLRGEIDQLGAGGAPAAAPQLPAAIS